MRQSVTTLNRIAEMRGHLDIAAHNAKRLDGRETRIALDAVAAMAGRHRRELDEKAPASPLENVDRYAAELDRLELAPNGDDFNALLELARGGPWRKPHTTGR